MRQRPEILDDGTRFTEKGVMVPECSDKLRLLTLEVLIDIRDNLHKDIAQLIEDLNYLAHRD